MNYLASVVLHKDMMQHTDETLLGDMASIPNNEFYTLFLSCLN